MNTLAELIADQGFDWWLAALIGVIALFPIWYIGEAISLDRLHSLPAEPEPWPQRQTPTDLAAAYTPDAHHRIEWADPRDDPAWQWATGELERIKARVYGRRKAVAA